MEKMDAYLQAVTQQGKFSGAVLAAQGGTVLYSAGYGLANREHEVPNTPQTKFRIGSITKQFTAMAILLLHEAGKLDLHDPICKHLPYSPDIWREITVHHLLNHTSGLVRTNDTATARKLPLTLREIVETITRTPLCFKPGTRQEYSNDGYILLGDIIERVSGRSYADFLRDHVFEPLEMTDSGYDEHEPVLPHRATGYQKLGAEWVHADYIDMGCPFAAGALYSTVEDLYRWDCALRARWLISPASHEAMTTVTPLLANYGYGLAIGREHDRRTIGHAGGINGFRANYTRFPEEDACIIVLSNSEASDFFGVSKTLGAILFGLDFTLPTVKQSVPIAGDRLAACTGVYEIAPNITLTVEDQDDRLIVASGKVRSEFVPESETAFFREESEDSLTFHLDDDGAIHHLLLRQGDVETPARRLPERRETRLIILEGMLGAGKSTIGAFLESHLVAQGIPAHFLPEWVLPHPIRLDDTLPHSYEPWLDLTVDAYLERSWARWAAFVRKRRFIDTVTVLDGQLFHGDLTNLLMMGASREQCDRHIAQITEITAPLCPAVIYLTSGDVRQSMDAICQTRGEDWRKRQVEWKTKSPYCQERGLSGYDGLVALYQDYRVLTDSLFADLRLHKMTLDTSAHEWKRYQESIVAFLPIAPIPARRGPTGDQKTCAILSR